MARRISTTGYSPGDDSSPSSHRTEHSPWDSSEYFDLVYSSRNRTLKHCIIRHIEREFFTANLGHCHHVLEIGCGTGEITLAIADGREVVSIDVNDKVLNLNRSRLSKKSVRFFKLNMFDLDRLTVAFDAVVANRAFMHLNESSLTAILRLAAKKISPGGRILFDLQHPTLTKRHAKKSSRRRFRHNIRHNNYTREDVLAILSEIPELKILKIFYYDHWLPLSFTSILPASLANGRIAVGFRNLDQWLSGVSVTAKRLGVVCERL